MASIKRCAEDVQLGPEAGGGWNPGEGDQDDQQAEGEHRPARGEAAVVFEGFPVLPIVSEVAQQGEGCQGHEGVGQQVEENSSLGGLAAVGIECRDNSYQQVAGVADG